MTGKRETPKTEILELNRETIQDLTEEQNEQARGGLAAQISRVCSDTDIYSSCEECCRA